MGPLEELKTIIHKLPLSAMKDIEKRITDWISMGGNQDDPYIEQQLRFAKNVLNAQEEMEVQK